MDNEIKNCLKMILKSQNELKSDIEKSQNELKSDIEKIKDNHLHDIRNDIANLSNKICNLKGKKETKDKYQGYVINIIIATISAVITHLLWR